MSKQIQISKIALSTEQIQEIPEKRGSSLEHNRVSTSAAIF